MPSRERPQLQAVQAQPTRTASGYRTWMACVVCCRWSLWPTILFEWRTQLCCHSCGTRKPTALGSKLLHGTRRWVHSTAESSLWCVAPCRGGGVSRSRAIGDRVLLPVNRYASFSCRRSWEACHYSRPCGSLKGLI